MEYKKWTAGPDDEPIGWFGNQEYEDPPRPEDPEPPIRVERKTPLPDLAKLRGRRTFFFFASVVSMLWWAFHTTWFWWWVFIGCSIGFALSLYAVIDARIGYIRSERERILTKYDMNLP